MVKAKLLEAQSRVGRDEPSGNDGDTHPLLNDRFVVETCHIRSRDTAQISGTKGLNETPKSGVSALMSKRGLPLSERKERSCYGKSA
jgi:hypothetical protein